MWQEVNRYYISPPAMSPLGRVIAGLIAALSVIGAFIFGIFVLGIAIGLGVILILVASARNWWQRRNSGWTPPQETEQSRESIEAEYTVISRRQD